MDQEVGYWSHSFLIVAVYLFLWMWP